LFPFYSMIAGILWSFMLQYILTKAADFPFFNASYSIRTCTVLGHFEMGRLVTWVVWWWDVTECDGSFRALGCLVMGPLVMGYCVMGHFVMSCFVVGRFVWESCHVNFFSFFVGKNAKSARHEHFDLEKIPYISWSLIFIVKSKLNE
jgi:hypothetical protein